MGGAVNERTAVVSLEPEAPINNSRRGLQDIIHVIDHYIQHPASKNLYKPIQLAAQLLYVNSFIILQIVYYLIIQYDNRSQLAILYRSLICTTLLVTALIFSLTTYPSEVLDCSEGSRLF